MAYGTLYETAVKLILAVVVVVIVLAFISVMHSRRCRSLCRATATSCRCNGRAELRLGAAMRFCGGSAPFLLADGWGIALQAGMPHCHSE
jgi:hypothetical protein